MYDTVCYEGRKPLRLPSISDEQIHVLLEEEIQWDWAIWSASQMINWWIPRGISAITERIAGEF